MQQLGPCAEKVRLVREFSRAAEAYADSVSVFACKAGLVAREEYEQLRLISERAREEVEEARLALQAHTGKHGC